MRSPTLTTLLLAILALSSCTTDDVTKLKTNLIYDSDENKAFMKAPRALIGKYYEAEPKSVIPGSTTFDNAMEIQTIAKLSGDTARAMEGNKSKIGDLRSKTILLNDGMNKENAKASTLVKVIDVKVKGERAAAVRVLALNKLYAGGQWWVGTEVFLVQFHEIPSPVNDSRSSAKLDTNTSATQAEAHGGLHKGANHSHPQGRHR